MSEFDYYLADQDNFARIFRAPVGCSKPLEVYSSLAKDWIAPAVSSLDDIASGVRPLPMSSLAQEIRICNLISRGVQSTLKVKELLDKQYANN